MPLTRTNTGNPIRNRGTIPNLTQAQREEVHKVIGQLTFADMGRGAGTLHTVGSTRLDMQGTTATGAANLQVQIGTHTVAAALIANSVLATHDPINQRGASNGAQSVLNQSLDTRTIWALNGSLP